MRIKPVVRLKQEEDFTFYLETRPDFGFYTSNYYEIVVPMGGTVEYSFDNKKRTLSKGTGIIFSPDVLRRVTVRGENGSCLFIRYDKSVCENVFKVLGSDTFQAFLSVPTYNFDVTEEFIQSVSRAIQLVHISEEENRVIAMKKLQFEVFSHFVPFFSFYAESDVTCRALAVMNDPQNISFRLPEVAEKVGCSEEYLVRCFKKSGLETPNTVFKRIKLRYAKSVLLNGRISVALVAAKVGFRSVGHFNKLYSAEFGVCPGSDKIKQ